MKVKELREKYPVKEFGDIRVTRDYTMPKDWRVYDETEVTDNGWQFELPYDRSIIGGIKDAEKFIADIEEAINYVKGLP